MPVASDHEDGIHNSIIITTPLGLPHSATSRLEYQYSLLSFDSSVVWRRNPDHVDNTKFLPLSAISLR
jgi:hypothetical protein